MTTYIITCLLKNKKRNFVLLILISYFFALLLLRAKYTQSIYLFFMIWNLALAYVPLIISNYITSHFNRLSKIKFYFLMISWLAFIPNSFYIITDLVHLVRSKGNLFWLDSHIIFTATITGFWFGLISLDQINAALEKKYHTKTATIITASCTLLCGFGIYIGRILRFNSWDIITNPFTLLQQLLYSISKESILISLHFGIAITLFYWLSKKLK